MVAVASFNPHEGVLPAHLAELFHEPNVVHSSSQLGYFSASISFDSSIAPEIVTSDKRQSGESWPRILLNHVEIFDLAVSVISAEALCEDFPNRV